MSDSQRVDLVPADLRSDDRLHKSREMTGSAAVGAQRG